MQLKRMQNQKNNKTKMREIKTEKINTDKVIERIKKSEYPLIVAGHGIRLSKTQKDFYKLIEKLKIPVVTTFNGFDLLETNNKYYMGRIGTVGQRAGNFVLQNADLILFLGTRNNIRQVSYNWENFAKKAFKIVVDIDNNELQKPLVKPDLEINANLKDFIPQLLKKINNVNPSKYSNWLAFCGNLKNKYCFENYKEQKQTKNIIEPYNFVYTLTKCLKEKDIFVMANGSACVCGFQTAVVKKDQRFILNGGDASMGYALPASIGASLSAKERNVVCLEGDGSIMMNIQELQTIKHNNLPIKIFVINNNGYSSIRQTQKNFFNGQMTGSGTDSGVSVPDFVKVGKAFGLKTKRIKNPKIMEKEIKEVLKLNGPVLCEVMVEKEYAFLPKLSSKKLPDGTMVSPTLEDMFPFLDRKEFEENIINQ